MEKTESKKVFINFCTSSNSFVNFVLKIKSLEEVCGNMLYSPAIYMWSTAEKKTIYPKCQCYDIYSSANINIMWSEWHKKVVPSLWQRLITMNWKYYVPEQYFVYGYSDKNSKIEKKIMYWCQKWCDEKNAETYKSLT